MWPRAGGAGGIVVDTDAVLSRHAKHAEILLASLAPPHSQTASCVVSPVAATSALPALSPPHAMAALAPPPVVTPFASPPPPYSPQHPHVMLDHEKLPPHPEVFPPPLLPADLALVVDAGSHITTESPKPRGLRGDDADIFHLSPSAALTLLARSVELLVSLTGEVPPTPPLSAPVTPENVGTVESGYPSKPRRRVDEQHGYFFGASEGKEEIDGVVFKSPRKHAEEDCSPVLSEANPLDATDIATSGISVIHAGVGQELQHAAISRKFWSRSAPDIGIEDYLFRIHRFCPLSTAVYLAASVYLHHLSVDLHIIPITHLNVHRLLLAALRIAGKTLEDMSYPHRRFAKVGGLSELELSRLEVSFAFLMNFDLKVDRAMLERQVEVLRETVERQVSLGKRGLALARRRNSVKERDGDGDGGRGAR